MTRVQAKIEADGELHLSGLPFKKGESIEVQMEPSHVAVKRLTARQMREISGIWKDRQDIADDFARTLRSDSGARQ